MITGEEVMIFIKQNTMPSRMSGSWNDEKIFAENARLLSVENDLCTRLRMQLIPVNDPLRSEMLRVPVCIGDIVLMSEKDRRYSAHRFEFFYEIRNKFRR